MFNLEKIMKLNAEEIAIVNGLQEVAKEAKEHVELIHKAYRCFGIGEDKIEVFRDGNNFEYLTHDGIWQARYLHQEYNIKIDVDTIYDYYRAAWLVKNGYADDCKDSFLTDYGNKNRICGYFRSFVRRITLPESEE